MAPRRIILDCDPGNGVPGANVDDALALAYALRSPLVDVRAVWTVFGNTPPDLGYRCASEVIRVVGAGGSGADGGPSASPVLRCGPFQPASGDPQRWLRQRRESASSPAGLAAWGRRPERASVREEADGDAAGEVPPARLDDLVDDLRCPEQTTLVGIGPLTNIARVLTGWGAAPGRVDRIVVMGGALAFGTMVDTNFAVDPRAARVVVRFGIPVTIVPLDTTRTTCLTRDRWRAIIRRAAEKGPMAVATASAFDAWVSPWLSYSEATRPVDGMWVHDLVALVALAHPELVDSSQHRVDVRDDGKLVECPDGVPVDIVEAVDNEAMISLWERTVFDAGAAAPPP